MLLTNNIEKSQPQGECLHLATSPSQDQKAELPFLPSVLNRCPAMPWVYYLLGRTRGPVGTVHAGLSGQPERAAKPEALRKGGGARWAVEEGL